LPLRRIAPAGNDGLGGTYRLLTCVPISIDCGGSRGSPKGADRTAFPSRLRAISLDVTWSFHEHLDYPDIEFDWRLRVRNHC
jgi:hypothetical protein